MNIGRGDQMLSRFRTPIRTAQRLGLAVTLCAAGALTATPARADSGDVYGGRVYMPEVVITTSSCINIPIHYDLSRMPADYNWTIDVQSDFYSGGFDYDTGPAKGTTGIQWCEQDLPGRYTATVIVDVKDENYGDVTTDESLLTFTIRKATTRATVKVGDATLKTNQTTNIRGCVTAHSKRQAYRQVAIEYHWKGRPWKRLMYAYTDGTGCYREPFYSKYAGALEMRVRVPGDGISKVGYSKAVKVKVRM